MLIVLLADVLGMAQAKSADTLAVQINADRITLSMTGVPQVYLYGVIDAHAPERIGAMIRSGKIPKGSDIYLNAAAGEEAAGIALGQLFRDGAMATHLGAPRKIGRRINPSRNATCAGACAYAYVGGLYRWPPAGEDRFGLPKAAVEPSSGSAAALFLQAMTIDVAAIRAAARSANGPMLWLSADQMISSGLANNGRLATTAQYRLTPPKPTLTLKQVDRHGEHRITFSCRPGAITLTAYDEVGATRARQIVARNTRSFFERGDQEILTQAQGGAVVEGDAVKISRIYPPDRLVTLFSARSLGAWVGGSSDAFRDGFALALYPVRHAITDYYNACYRAAPWPTRQAQPRR